MPVKPIPDGYHTITPYLSVHGVPEVITFLREAFGAEQTARHTAPDGTVLNAEVRVGDSMIMLGEKPRGERATPAMLYLYVEDADAVFRRAVGAGAKVIHEVVDQFYGDRSGGVEDCAGNQWWIATRKENLTPEEMQRRAAQHRRG
jgi:uncharacterized glyoxalase superfamily protein PhnB